MRYTLCEWPKSYINMFDKIYTIAQIINENDVHPVLLLLLLLHVSFFFAIFRYGSSQSSNLSRAPPIDMEYKKQIHIFFATYKIAHAQQYGSLMMMMLLLVVVVAVAYNTVQRHIIYEIYSIFPYHSSFDSAISVTIFRIIIGISFDCIVSIRMLFI